MQAMHDWLQAHAADLEPLLQVQPPPFRPPKTRHGARPQSSGGWWPGKQVMVHQKGSAIKVTTTLKPW